jgi:AAA+ ATPase superfamily predicted ATPase
VQYGMGVQIRDMTTRNPFTFGNPIQDPACFYGRKQEIRLIVNRLISSTHESTSIVGERRIGKTSLLNYLSNPDVAAGLGLAADKYCLVYINFQGLTDITPQRFWQRILSKMACGFCGETLVPSINSLSKRTDFDLFDLEDLFEQIKSAGITVVLFMDEFEYVTQNPNFKSDFFGGLCGLAIHSGLALVPATRREFVDLCHSEELKGSPFFNIFANVVLRPFNRGDASELIDAMLIAKNMVFSPDEKEFVLKLGGGHPFFLQMSGYYMAEGKLQGSSSTALLEYAANALEQHGNAHCSFLWSHCSESEKITLLVTLILAQQPPSKKMPPTQENLSSIHPHANLDLPTLLKRGMLLESDRGYRLFSPSLERWIAREVLAIPGEEESQKNVDEWLKTSGRSVVDTMNAPVKTALPRFKKQYWTAIGGILKGISNDVIVNTMVVLITKTFVG